MVAWSELILSYVRLHRAQILVTATVSIIFMLGYAIPEPVLFEKRLASAFAHIDGSRLSIFAQGLSPWMASVLLVEMLCLIFPSIRSSSLAVAGHADPFSRTITGLTAGLSLFFALGMANAVLVLFQPDIVPSPVDTVAAAVSIMAGTVILIVLGRLLDQQFRNFGFGVLVLIASLSGLHHSAAHLWNGYATNQISGQHALLIAAVPPVLIVAMVWLFVAIGNRVGPGRPSFVFPWLFASIVPNLAFSLVPQAWMQSQSLQVYWTDYGTMTLAVLQALVLSLFIAIYFARQGMKSFFLMTLAVWTAVLFYSHLGSNWFAISGLQVVALSLPVSHWLSFVAKHQAAHEQRT